jgi:hypothetical protein
MQPILLKKSSISSRLLNCILGGILQRSAKLSAMGCTMRTAHCEQLLIAAVKTA